MASDSKSQLYDMPVSNCGARCRYIIYEKGLEGAVEIVPPSVLGGLKSPEYLKLHPAGKMPLLVTETSTAIPESDCIARYLVDKYRDQGPSFTPETLELRTKADVIVRIHDQYIQPIQGAMYKAAPPFGPHTYRQDALKDIGKQLKAVEDLVSPEGPFMAGPEVSLADAALFPTFVFLTQILPKFGWTEDQILLPKTKRWWEHLQAQSTGARVKGEILGAFEGWDANKRWDGILGAGLKDTAPETIFNKILRSEIPSKVVYEDDHVLAFRDINPQAPTHVLIIPKHRDRLTQLRFATADNRHALGLMMEAAAKIAEQEKLGGYRLVINDGEEAGQEVFHLHMHLLAGRKMKWPPG